MTRVAVITIAAGRHEHLARQRAGLRACAPAADAHVVVAMRARDAAAYRADGATQVVILPQAGDALPLARARNAGAEHALAGGAGLLVFLDVDCIPAPALVGRYAAAASAAPGALLCGPVGYLPPAPDGGHPPGALARLARPHPARPLPREDELIGGGDHRLFWSLSFALTAATWRRIGGFGEEYAGYGGEDTDFGQRARERGVGLCWVGGAWAFHQHHPTATPPVQHLDAILANGARFRRRWGWWPMEGWLEAFARLGLIRHDAATDHWTRVA